MIFSRHDNLSRLSPAKVYSIAARAAEAPASRSQTARQKSLVATGARAVILAETGALMMGLGPSCPQSTALFSSNGEHYELYPDYVAYGSLAVFAAIKKVLRPAAALVGPNCYRIVPCDVDGNRLQDKPSQASTEFLGVPFVRGQAYSLKNTPADCWQAISAGVADAVVASRQVYKNARNVKGRARELAASSDNIGYAYVVIDTAATIVHRAVLAAQDQYDEAGSRNAPIRLMAEYVIPTANVDYGARIPHGDVVTVYDGSAEVA